MSSIAGPLNLSPAPPVVPTPTPANPQTILTVFRLRRQAVMPVSLAPGESNAFEIYAGETRILSPRRDALIRTGLAIKVPHGTHGMVGKRYELFDAGLMDKGIDVGCFMFSHNFRCLEKMMFFLFLYYFCDNYHHHNIIFF